MNAPPGHDTRPITDRIKQALFDWLGQDLNGITMADVCSGSGAIAFEAASRGATRVHAIESAPAALAVLRANHVHLGRDPRVVIHPLSFVTVLPTLSALDLIFCDPPFPWYSAEPQRIAELLTLGAAALRPGGNLLIRGDAGTELPPCSALRRCEQRTWGRSWIVWLERPEHAADTTA